MIEDGAHSRNFDQDWIVTVRVSHQNGIGFAIDIGSRDGPEMVGEPLALSVPEIAASASFTVV